MKRLLLFISFILPLISSGQVQQSTGGTTLYQGTTTTTVVVRGNLVVDSSFRLPIYTDATRPTLPIAGFAYNIATHSLEYGDGTNVYAVSTTVVPVLATPASITPTGGNHTISVAFALVTSATNYIAEASADNFVTIAASSSGSTSPRLISGLTNGTAYKTRVKATATGYVTSPYRVSAGTTTPQ